MDPISLNDIDVETLLYMFLRLTVKFPRLLSPPAVGEAGI